MWELIISFITVLLWFKSTKKYPQLQAFFLRYLVWVFVYNFCYELEFDWYENPLIDRTHLCANGFTQWLILTQRYMVMQKLPIEWYTLLVPIQNKRIHQPKYKSTCHELADIHVHCMTYVYSASRWWPEVVVIVELLHAQYSELMSSKVKYILYMTLETGFYMYP